MAEVLIAGMVLGAVGSIQQGNAAADAANFNAQVANQNSALALQRGEESAARVRRDNLRHQGAQKAAIGGSGLKLTGTVLDVLSDSAIEGELMALDAKNAAVNEARGLRAQAGLSRSKAESARSAGFLGAGSALLSGVEKYIGA